MLQVFCCLINRKLIARYRVQLTPSKQVRISYFLLLKPGKTCVAHVTPIADRGETRPAHVPPKAHPWANICI